MKHLLRAVAALLVLFTGCSDRSDQIDALISSEPSLARLERQLDWTVAAAMALSGDGASPGLEAEQEGWRGGLQRCLDAAEPARCVGEAHRERLADLQDRFDLDPRSVAIHAAGRAGFEFRAVGNEPGWNLLLSSRHAVWETDYGQTRHEFEDLSAEIDGDLRIFQTRLDDEPLKILVERSPCTDDMSGEEFDFRFEIRHAGRIWRGCGDATTAR